MGIMAPVLSFKHDVAAIFAVIFATCGHNQQHQLGGTTIHHGILLYSLTMAITRFH